MGQTGDLGWLEGFLATFTRTVWLLGAAVIAERSTGVIARSMSKLEIEIGLKSPTSGRHWEDYGCSSGADCAILGDLRSYCIWYLLDVLQRISGCLPKRAWMKWRSRRSCVCGSGPLHWSCFAGSVQVVPNWAWGVLGCKIGCPHLFYLVIWVMLVLLCPRSCLRTTRASVTA